MEDPMEAARRVLENAPRRKLERQGTVTRKRKSAPKPVEGNNDVPTMRTRATRGRHMVRSAASRRKKGSEGSRPRKRKEDESTPEDLREVRPGPPLIGCVRLTV